MVLSQNKRGNLSSRKDIMTCYYCSKPNYIARILYNTKNLTKIIQTLPKKIMTMNLSDNMEHIRISGSWIQKH